MTFRSAFENDQKSKQQHNGYDMQVESTPPKKKQNLLRRMAQKILPTKKSQQLETTFMPQQQQQQHGDFAISPLSQKLYNIPQTEIAKRGSIFSPITTTLPQNPVQQQQQNRPLNGPIPNSNIIDTTHNLLLPYPDITDTSTHLTSFAQQTSLAFLTPLESHIYTLLLNSRRASHFRPLLSPKTSVLLVSHPADLLPLLSIQEMVAELPESEKEILERDLKGHLLPAQRFILGVLLWNTGVEVKGNMREIKMETDEGVGRPSSVEMFGGWRREWEGLPLARDA